MAVLQIPICSRGIFYFHGKLCGEVRFGRFGVRYALWSNLVWIVWLWLDMSWRGVHCYGFTWYALRFGLTWWDEIGPGELGFDLVGLVMVLQAMHYGLIFNERILLLL